MQESVPHHFKRACKVQERVPYHFKRACKVQESVYHMVSRKCTTLFKENNSSHFLVTCKSGQSIQNS